MGGWFSSETTENKTVDSNGVVTNTIVMNDMLHIRNDGMLILLGVIAFCQITQLGIYVYSQHMKSIKKKERTKFNFNTSSA